MCITVGTPANLSKTIVYAAEVLHPTEGAVHVIGYQNTVDAHPGPGAMILPFPTNEKLSPKNVIEDDALKGALKVYESAVERMKPRLRSFGFTKDATIGASATLNSYQVFDSGSYTVCLVESAPSLVEALKLVPEDRRPGIDTHFIFELAKAYPKTPMALCCFSGKNFEAEPIFWWYKPRDQETLVAPGIDGHGRPPQPGIVGRDHTLVFGSYKAQGLRDGAGVGRYLPKHWALTDAIVGSQLQGRLTNNGDFVFKTSDLTDSKIQGYLGADQIRVQQPPGWV